jgi:exo-beta-1,3-glucanase (GH17 family)
MDNLGATAAGGGIAGIAYGIANTNERESGLDAQRAMENTGQAPFRGPPEREFQTVGSDNPYVPQPPPPPQHSDPTRSLRQSDSYSSTIPLGAAAATPGHATPTPSTPGQPRSERGSSRGELGPTGYMGGGGMYDDPYQRRSQWVNPGAINPDDIADDGDDGFTPNPKRRSMLSLNRNSSHDILPGATTGTAGASGGAAAGGVLGTLGGLMHRQRKGATASGVYGAVPGAGEESGAEKSEWLKSQTTRNRKMRLWVGILIGAAVIAAIVGAIVGGVIGSRKSGGGGGSDSSSQGESASEDDGHGDLDKNSAEIKRLMNNPNLHKVFPGMDYTPFNAQYPACLTNPPSQNNVTRDIAVLSQLTNTIRTYGTDCNQTAMVVHAFDKLELSNMKLWIGVWVDKNDTTLNRQLEAMYDQVENGPGQSYFKGVIVGNEALFNGFTEPELAVILEGVRSNFTTKNVDLPLATSDLGSNWTPALAELVDVVMSNVHPFFAGVTSVAAAGWTWQFWQDNDVVLTKGMANKKQIIAEVGWPSGGGNDCGTSVPTCPTTTAGSVAGIDEMNTFMSDWVCQSMANGTDYFW